MYDGVLLIINNLFISYNEDHDMFLVVDMVIDFLISVFISLLVYLPWMHDDYSRKSTYTNQEILNGYLKHMKIICSSYMQ